MKEAVSNEAGITRRKREIYRTRNRLIIGIVALMVITAALVLILLS